jgi:LmbE family N-acetylglucosaminyl deacetylase
MQSISLARPNGDPLKILCLGAHADDIEIGCGGTLLTLLESHGPVHIHWVVFTTDDDRAHEAALSAETLLKDVAQKSVSIRQFRDGFLPFSSPEVKECFEEIKKEVSPDIIFTHYRDDRHQDHRLISDLTWNTWRDHLILEYEVPKYDGDFGTPNVFVPLGEAVCKRKIDHLLASFPSQRGAKYWFTEETFLAVARLRGMESGPGNRFAEAFYCRKSVLV